MLAVEKGNLEVAKLMVKKDPCLVTLQLGSGETVIHWALERDLDTFFEVTLALLWSLGRGKICTDTMTFKHKCHVDHMALLKSR